MIELVFSFILNTWGGLQTVHTWAQSNLGGAQVLTDLVYRDQQILCALERQGALVYDGQWKERKDLVIPRVCIKDVSKEAKVISNISFRSATLASVPKLSSWDQQIDLRLKGEAPYSVYFRHDKNHVGAHSTAGWAMWVERRKGSVRFEMVNPETQMHFRLKARGNVNSVKGDFTEVHHIEALHVNHDKGEVQKAHIFFGNAKESTEVVFNRESESLNKKELKRGVHASFASSWASRVGEKELKTFSDVSSQKYRDFIQSGAPLAFTSVNPEQTVPETAVFR